MSQLSSSETILLHAESMKKETSKQEMKVLKKVNEKKYMEYLVNRYNDLHVNYPALFNLLALDGEKFDMNKLKQMLREKDRVEKNEVSLQSASEQLGKQYFNEYCNNKVNWDKEKEFVEKDN